MSPTADKAQNIAQARALIEARGGEQKPDLIALPEIWTCLGGDRATKFAASRGAAGRRQGRGGEAYEFLRGMAAVRIISMCMAAPSASSAVTSGR
jgi:predicted amidohydrolase